MSENISIFDGSDPRMAEACEEARRTFKFFWRELSWERRRIIPALGVVAVKLPFRDEPETEDGPECEQMWCEDVDFDGEFLTCRLLNSPNWLTSVKEGDEVRRPLSELSDWLMSDGELAYGGFTVNLMRSEMSPKERAEHDAAWGLDFGDPASIRLELPDDEPRKKGFLSAILGSICGRKREPAQEGFRDHPACINVLPDADKQMSEDPSIVEYTDERGWPLLHSEAMAGNLGMVRLLLKHGADIHARTPEGKSAADLARAIGWQEVADFLVQQEKA